MTVKTMFATLYFPNVYLQAALRHQPELRSQPVVLLDGVEAKAVIIQLNKAAQQFGIRSGMTPSQALARCLSLVVKVRERPQEQQLATIILQFASTLSPYVEETAAGICTVEFTDNRSLEAKLMRAIDQLAELGLIASAGIAQTPDTSLLAAHLARPVLQVGDARSFLASLPIETLSAM